MPTATNEPNVDAGPVFDACVRCGYSLLGLPAEHACPECGLRFDERCAVYRAANSKKVFVWGVISTCVGWLCVLHFSNLARLLLGTVGKVLMTVFGITCLVSVAVAIRRRVRRYRQGFCVAITTDGLFIRLPDIPDEFIPWRHIGRASIDHGAEGAPQIAIVYLEHKKKTISIGGPINVFPRRADVERFVREAQERSKTAHANAEIVP